MPTYMNRQKLIEYIQKTENLSTILNCFKYRGIASISNIKSLTALTQRQIRYALSKLINPPKGLPSALIETKINIENQRGRPVSIFVLTDDGLAVMKMINGGVGASKPIRLDNSAELAHAYIEMSILCIAQAANKEVDIEHVIPYSESPHRNIRPDLVISKKQERPFLIEIENYARGYDRKCITEKIYRMDNFFSSRTGKRYDNRVIFFFNISVNDNKTIKVWQKCLCEAAAQKKKDLSFKIYWETVSGFLEHPDFDQLQGFQGLEAHPDQESANKQTKDNEAIIFDDFEFDTTAIDLLEAHQIMQSFTNLQDRKHIQKDLEYHHRRCYHFFQLMMTIYKASHYPDSPTLLYSAYPKDSILLLKQYLHMPQNNVLLKELKQHIKNIAFGADKGMGVTRYKNTVTKMIWDCFLRHHGFARGGPLLVAIQVPELNDLRSDYYVEVKIWNRSMLRDDDGFVGYYLRECAQKSLTWILEALYVYPRALGLVDRSNEKRKG
jgi:hypothetical protein